MNFLKEKFLALFLIFIYLLEGLSKYYLYVESVQLKFVRHLKLILFILVFIYLILKKRFKFFLIPTILFVFFLLGHYLMENKFISYKLSVVFAKYIFPIFILEASYVYFKDNSSPNIFKAFEFIIIINSIAIILGLVFDIYLFETYRGKRFGFNGLLVTSATGTYFYIIAIYYLYLIRIKSNKHIILSVLVLLAALIVGTKSIYLFLGLLLVYYIFYHFKKINISKKIIISIVLITLLSVLFLAFVPSFIRISNKENFGIITAILSYRDQLFFERTLPFIYENWTTFNFFIGGQSAPQDRTQLGFIDLLFFFGFLGAILYTIAFYKSFIKKKLNSDTVFLLISLSIIVFLGGNFFYSTTITIYLFLIQQTLLNYKN